MLISNPQVNKVFELHMHKIHLSQVKPSDPIGRSDKLTLSGRANEIQWVKTFVSALQDVRNDTVRPLQRMVGKDLYQPKDCDIASAILADAAQSQMRS
ncbi:MAG: flagellar biosynthesis anti-sigma factor FlgM [Armatimonadetes bacterium]|jgi:hypothetical protein|nr:flagellar biosynthesis anti-sigma factor FlgM [Armatimonadota bacterium]